MNTFRPVLQTAKAVISRPPARQLHRTFATTQPRRAREVKIVEVGPRDGLQNEKQSIPVDMKLDLIRRLAGTGLGTIEAGSFVSPKWVPQMASSNEILEDLLNNPQRVDKHLTYQWLLPNVKGLENFFATWDAVQSTHKSSSSSTSSDSGPALNTSSFDANAMPSATSGVDAMSKNNSGAAADTHEISIFMAATEAFSRKNTNRSIADSLATFKPLIASAKSRGFSVRGYVSVALGCPYEGVDVDPHKVAQVTAELLGTGCDEVSVCDTTGYGTPASTTKLLKTLTAAGIQNRDLALHFHDTFGLALPNTLVALEHGVTTFDSAVGGLGGCPFSPGATGNVATEDLVHLLHSLGADTGVDLGRIAEIGGWISQELGKNNESRAGKATLAKTRSASS